MPEADPKLQRVEITIAWMVIIKVLLGCLLALVAVLGSGPGRIALARPAHRHRPQASDSMDPAPPLA